jgi:hypothetical protein
VKIALDLKRIFWSYRSSPEFEHGEKIVFEGKAVLFQGVLGGRIGPLILTNRRLIWYEPSVARPLKPIHGELRLSEISSVDKGTLLDLLFGGRRLRLRLRNGRAKCLIENDGRLDEWVAKVREAVSSAQTVGS